MKILCIGRNYAEHAKELQNEIPESPVVFMKPATALLKDNQPLYYPEWTKDLHYETEIVLRISKQGKYIKEKFARDYFQQISLGIDFTARDLQNIQKSKGLPWEIAKAFDHSAVIGDFININNDMNDNGVDFSMTLNDELKQSGNTKDMIFSFEKLIAYVSQFFTLQQGDLIYTGTPSGVGPVKIGDKIKGYIGDKCMFECSIK